MNKTTASPFQIAEQKNYLRKLRQNHYRNWEQMHIEKDATKRNNATNRFYKYSEMIKIEETRLSKMEGF